MIKIIIIVIASLFLFGCDYIPHERFEIKTESGEIITLSCPIISEGRSKVTYLIDGECVIVK